MKDSIKDVQKNIYNYLKNKAHTLEGKKSNELIKYQRDQNRLNNRKFYSSNIGELSSSIDDSEIIYLGDFHTFDQSSRNLKRIIDIIKSKKHEFAIGLELVHVNHQKFIDYFLAGHITELEFLESINYTESWRFPWTYYKTFFEIAKKTNIPIIALNTQGSLSQRDKKAAKVLAEFHKNSPQKKILVLFGEYHIVKNKLPNQVLKCLNKSVIQTIIHQNLDEVYWKLSKSNKPLMDKVLKFNKREYILLTSAPWLKYESQIYWYEHLSEDPEFDIHEYIIENGALNFSENVPENFYFLCQHINKTLQLDIDDDKLEEFTLYDHIRLEQVQKSLMKAPSTKIQNLYHSLIKRGRSFKIYNQPRYFCPNYSINRLSYIAGIHCYITLKPKNYLEDLLSKNKREEFFYYHFEQCLIAYFCSKLINPYRKCDMYRDYKNLLKGRSIKGSKRSLYKTGLSILDKKKTPIKDQIKGYRLLGLYNLGRMLGHMVGDILFDTVFLKDEESFHQLAHEIILKEVSEDKFRYILEKVAYKNNYKDSFKRTF